MQKMMENLTKVCSTCKVENNLCDFGKEKRNKSGISNECNKCKYKRSLEWGRNNPEKRKENQRLYELRHLQEIKEKRDIRHIKNPEKRIDASTKYKINNQQKIKESKTKRINDLPDTYIKQALKYQNYPQELINNPEFIEVKRLIIKTKRLCRTSRN